MTSLWSTIGFEETTKTDLISVIAFHYVTKNMDWEPEECLMEHYEDGEHYIDANELAEFNTAIKKEIDELEKWLYANRSDEERSYDAMMSKMEYQWEERYEI